MALNASKIASGGSRKRQPPLEAGSSPARLVQLIDLGVQTQRPYKGEEKPPKPEIYTTYELLDEFVVDDEGNEDLDKPRWVSERLPMHALDSDLAKSTKRYIALDPEQKFKGDWVQLMGTPCTVTLSADKSNKKGDDGEYIVYNNITSVSPMKAKDVNKAEPLKNPTKVFDGEDPDMDVFFSLPDWLREIIKEGLNFEGSTLEKALSKFNEKDEVAKRRAANSEAGAKSKPKDEPAEEPEDSDESDDGDW